MARYAGAELIQMAALAIGPAQLSVHPSHAERFIFVHRHDEWEELNEEQEGLVASDLGESRNGGDRASRPQIYEAQGDREFRHRECRQAPVSENGFSGDPGPHPRQRSAAAGQAGFPVRYVQIRRL